MVTIQDVARRAGVSPMTVSNVLNERGQVRGTTREKVLTAIDELGYRVNIAARNLKAGRTGTVGLAIPELDRAYSGELAARIVRAGQRLGYRVVVEETGARKEDELDAIALSRVRLYDGLILSAVGLGASELNHLRAGGPVVLLGERVSDSPVDHVGMPNAAGARAVTEHLLGLGRRRIAVVGAPPGFHDNPDEDEISAALLRIRGFREGLSRAGVDFDADLVASTDEWSMAGGWRATNGLLAQGRRFDAVIGLTEELRTHAAERRPGT